MYFGYSMEHLFIRLDPEAANGGAVGAEWLARIMVRGRGQTFALEVACPPADCARLSLTSPAGARTASAAQACRGPILEIALPWSDLDIPPGTPFAFHVEIIKDGNPVQRLPEHAEIEGTTPDQQYEASHWVV
jgi:hypothetical protein